MLPYRGRVSPTPPGGVTQIKMFYMERKEVNMKAFRYMSGKTGLMQSMWNDAVVISRCNNFYDVLKNAGVKCVAWEYVPDTWAIVDSDNLPTGVVVQLVDSWDADEQPTDETDGVFIW